MHTAFVCVSVCVSVFKCLSVCVPLSDIIPLLWLSKKVDPCEGSVPEVLTSTLSLSVCTCVCMRVWACVCVCVWPWGAWACKFSPQKEVWGDYREERWENLGALSHSLTRQAAFKDRQVCMCTVCVVCLCVCVHRERLLPHQKAHSIFPLYADTIFVCSRRQRRLTLYPNDVRFLQPSSRATSIIFYCVWIIDCIHLHFLPLSRNEAIISWIQTLPSSDLEPVWTNGAAVSISCGYVCSTNCESVSPVNHDVLSCFCRIK